MSRRSGLAVLALVCALIAAARGAQAYDASGSIVRAEERVSAVSTSTAGDDEFERSYMLSSAKFDLRHSRSEYRLGIIGAAGFGICGLIALCYSFSPNVKGRIF